MGRLLLLRHAKAGWAEPGMRDFDRRLTRSGADDAITLGETMRAGGFAPDRVLCSTARRARETWEGVSRHLGVDAAKVMLTEALYSSDSAGYLGIIRSAGDVETLLVIGHNPMIEDVAFALSGEAHDDARQTLSSGFPTAGLAVVRFADGLSAIQPGGGRLEAFLTPAG